MHRRRLLNRERDRFEAEARSVGNPSSEEAGSRCAIITLLDTLVHRLRRFRCSQGINLKRVRLGSQEPRVEDEGGGGGGGGKLGHVPCSMKAIVRVKPCTWTASIRDCREFLIQISGRRPILRSARRILIRHWTPPGGHTWLDQIQSSSERNVWMLMRRPFPGKSERRSGYNGWRCRES